MLLHGPLAILYSSPVPIVLFFCLGEGNLILCAPAHTIGLVILTDCITSIESWIKSNDQSEGNRKLNSKLKVIQQSRM